MGGEGERIGPEKKRKKKKIEFLPFLFYH